CFAAPWLLLSRPTPRSSDLIRQAARDGSSEIAVGNLDVTRDFLDVRDVVRAYLLLLRHGAGGEVYNVASGVGQRLDQVLALLTRSEEHTSELQSRENLVCRL